MSKFSRNKLILASVALNIIFLWFIVFKVVSGLQLPRLLASVTKPVPKKSTQTTNPFDEINPRDGYEIDATYGELGPKMLAMGVIDFEKFQSVYNKSGQKLTPEQLDILQKGSQQKIRITSENSYFLLNFFWAVGLANHSRILTDGDMVKFGNGNVSGYASTGGWSLGKDTATRYYAQNYLIRLTPAQEARLEKVSSQIYRPCCDNSTAFPDCNHGMALLGILELMASNNASEKEMYKASKYINAFFFPANYYDIALYFKNKDNKKFADVDPQTLLGKQYSSATGWSSVKAWLTKKGIIQKPPSQGNGCGV